MGGREGERGRGGRVRRRGGEREREREGELEIGEIDDQEFGKCTMSRSLKGLCLIVHHAEKQVVLRLKKNTVAK